MNVESPGEWSSSAWPNNNNNNKKYVVAKNLSLKKNTRPSVPTREVERDSL